MIAADPDAQTWNAKHVERVGRRRASNRITKKYQKFATQIIRRVRRMALLRPKDFSAPIVADLSAHDGTANDGCKPKNL